MAKKQKREFKGDTNPELLKKALAALQPQYGDPWTEKPTSVELFEDRGYARVWFEYEEDHASEISFDWEFSLALPIFYFWGKKKRDKYLKQRRIELNG